MKVFRKMNFEIFQPKKEQCNECTMFKNKKLKEEDYVRERSG